MQENFLIIFKWIKEDFLCTLKGVWDSQYHSRPVHPLFLHYEKKFIMKNINN